MAKRKTGFVGVRPVFTADDVEQVKRDPENPDAKLDIERDESFPASVHLRRRSRSTTEGRHELR